MGIAILVLLGVFVLTLFGGYDTGNGLVLIGAYIGAGVFTLSLAILFIGGVLMLHDLSRRSSSPSGSQ